MVVGVAARNVACFVFALARQVYHDHRPPTHAVEAAHKIGCEVATYLST